MTINGGVSIKLLRERENHGKPLIYVLSIKTLFLGYFGVELALSTMFYVKTY